MRICLHTIWEINNKHIGGTERFLLDLSKELRAIGFSPFILCSGLQKKGVVEGVEIVRSIPEIYQGAVSAYKNIGPDFFKNEVMNDDLVESNLKNLSKYVEMQLRGVDADIYHLNSFASGSFISPWKPFIVTNHENELEYEHYWGEGFFQNMAELILNKKTQLHKFDALLTPSRYYANRFSKMFGLEIKGINLGVCLNNFETTYPQLESRMGGFKNGNKATILLPSRFEVHQKGHDIAVEACAILKKSGTEVNMIFTGLRDDYVSKLMPFNEYIKQNDVLELITVTRFDRIQDAYNKCDLVISPERYCSYGLSISESLSLGIPTILSDIPTYKEIAQKFKHAHFFKTGSASSLAKTILKLLNASFDKLDRSAIKFRMQYDLRVCAKKYSQIYMDIS